MGTKRAETYEKWADRAEQFSRTYETVSVKAANDRAMRTVIYKQSTRDRDAKAARILTDMIASLDKVVGQYKLLSDLAGELAQHYDDLAEKAEDAA